MNSNENVSRSSQPRSWVLTIICGVLALLCFAAAAYSFAVMSDAVLRIIATGTPIVFGVLLGILAVIGRARPIRELLDGISL